MLEKLNNWTRRLVAIAAMAAALAGCGGGGSSGVSGGSSTTFEWQIPFDEVVDGGPGKDGIPAINSPTFQAASAVSDVAADTYVVAVLVDGEVKAYPHNILDWHEVVNDGASGTVMSYCPLTGSAVAWKPDADRPNLEFGVSGLLYNSNLILYDRATDSRWSQMLERSVFGIRAGERPERLQIIETKFSTLRAMYPAARVLSRDTGWQRNYDAYPYGDYRTDASLLFPIAREDNRLHPKTRVMGIRSGVSGNDSKVYQLEAFGATTQTINDQFDNQPIVVVGNSVLDIAAIYGRDLADGTILTFSPLQDQLPNIMTDDEGNIWDVFGTAKSGPRAGTRLEKTQSFTAFWFAWVAFYNESAIHFN